MRKIWFSNLWQFNFNCLSINSSLNVKFISSLQCFSIHQGIYYHWTQSFQQLLQIVRIYRHGGTLSFVSYHCHSHNMYSIWNGTLCYLNPCIVYMPLPRKHVTTYSLEYKSASPQNGLTERCKASWVVVCPETETPLRVRNSCPNEDIRNRQPYFPKWTISST